MADPLLEPTTYRDFQLALHPSHLSRPWGAAWAQSYGLVKDGIRAGVVFAVKARFITVCPSDGLAYIGWERDLERGPNESSAQYRIRLKNAWRDYEFMGTDKGIVDNLAVLGLTAAVVRDRQWLHDGNPPGTIWSRMWIVITNPPWSFIETWSDLASAYATYAAYSATGRGWGLSATLDEIARITRIARKWTGSHALVVNIIVIARGRVFGFPPATSFLDSTVTWNPYVAYWDGF